MERLVIYAIAEPRDLAYQIHDILQFLIGGISTLVLPIDLSEQTIALFLQEHGPLEIIIVRRAGLFDNILHRFFQVSKEGSIREQLASDMVQLVGVFPDPVRLFVCPFSKDGLFLIVSAHVRIRLSIEVAAYRPGRQCGCRAFPEPHPTHKRHTKGRAVTQKSGPRGS